MAAALKQCTSARPLIELGNANALLKPTFIRTYVVARASPIRRSRRKSAPTRDDAPVSEDGSHYLRSEAIQVTKDISACQSWQQLALLHEEHDGRLWNINIAALFSRMAYLMDARSCSKLDGPELQQFTSFYTSLSYTACKAMQQGMQPAEMAIIAGAAGRIGIPRPWLYETLMEASEPFLASRVCSLQHTTQMAYGLAQARYCPSDSWIAALLHCTMLTISQAAVHAAWLSEQKRSQEQESGLTSRNRQGSTGKRSKTNRQSASGHAVQQRREDSSRQHQSGNQNGSKADPSIHTATDDTALLQSTNNMNSKRCASDARAVANLLHAVVCQMDVMPSTDWLHVWVLATEQLVPYANAIELVQMLEGLAQVSRFQKALHSNPMTRSPADSISHDAASIAVINSPQYVVSKVLSAPAASIGVPALSAQWQELVCQRVEDLTTDMSRTMAKATLRALGQLAENDHIDEQNFQQVFNVLRQMCSKRQPSGVDAIQGIGMSAARTNTTG